MIKTGLIGGGTNHMTTLEQEIIEKINQLDPEARQRVMVTIQNISLGSFDYAIWRKEVDKLREQIQTRIGEGNTLGALDLLEELREEE
jgi:hypothetical protein